MFDKSLWIYQRRSREVTVSVGGVRLRAACLGGAGLILLADFVATQTHLSMTDTDDKNRLPFLWSLFLRHGFMKEAKSFPGLVFTFVSGKKELFLFLSLCNHCFETKRAKAFVWRYKAFRGWRSLNALLLKAIVEETCNLRKCLWIFSELMINDSQCSAFKVSSSNVLFNKLYTCRIPFFPFSTKHKANWKHWVQEQLVWVHKFLFGIHLLIYFFSIKTFLCSLPWGHLIFLQCKPLAIRPENCGDELQRLPQIKKQSRLSDKNKGNKARNWSNFGKPDKAGIDKFLPKSISSRHLWFVLAQNTGRYHPGMVSCRSCTQLDLMHWKRTTSCTLESFFCSHLNAKRHVLIVLFFQRHWKFQPWRPSKNLILVTCPVLNENSSEKIQLPWVVYFFYRNGKKHARNSACNSPNFWTPFFWCVCYLYTLCAELALGFTAAVFVHTAGPVANRHVDNHKRNCPLTDKDYCFHEKGFAGQSLVHFIILLPWQHWVKNTHFQPEFHLWVSEEDGLTLLRMILTTRAAQVPN